MPAGSWSDQFTVRGICSVFTSLPTVALMVLRPAVAVLVAVSVRVVCPVRWGLAAIDRGDRPARG